MKILFILGTRPEAIKLAPLILLLKNSEYFEVKVCSTGQHREMLDQVLGLFEIVPDYDLGLMTHNQSLVSLNSLALIKLDQHLKEHPADVVIVQGDTTTVFSASLAAFYNKIKIVHVEAGLRTFDLYSPFPEEMNRVLTSRLVSIHFAPTDIAKANLLREGISSNDIVVTGNTVIDALLFVVEKIRNNYISFPKWISELNPSKTVLITGHRRENFGSGIEQICNAIQTLAIKYPDFEFVYPVHLNPNIKEPVERILSNHTNVKLVPPLDYVSFIALMDKSFIILTDSGGVQEEAPSLGKPVLVMRENSERPEAITAGVAKLVGTSTETIVASICELIEDDQVYNRMSKAINPYGDGTASKKIMNYFIENYN